MPHLLRNLRNIPLQMGTPAGMNIISPQWVLRSSESGSLQRVLTMSMDASRQIPSVSPACGVAAAAIDRASLDSGTLVAALSSVPADRRARLALAQSLAQPGEHSIHPEFVTKLVVRLISFPHLPLTKGLTLQLFSERQKPGEGSYLHSLAVASIDLFIQL